MQLSVISVGMVSSVGLNALASCAAIRARISRFEELPFHDQSGEPIIGAPATEAVPNRQGYKRLAPLLSQAISECITHGFTKNRKARNPQVLFVTIDYPHRPDYPQDLPQQVIEETKSILGYRFPRQFNIFSTGKTGFFRAIEEARQLFKTTEIDNCVVASVDSLLNGSALHWLEENERLKTEDNSDGVIPGEAAAALWLSRAHKNQPSMLNIRGLGFGEETSVLEEDAPNCAIGLAEALRNALTDSGMALHEIDFRVAGITGERLEFMEALTALARIQRIHKDNFLLWVPAEKLGDVGAALAACMMVVTAVAFEKGYAPGQSALLYVSSLNSPERAACVVSSSIGAQNG